MFIYIIILLAVIDLIKTPFSLLTYIIGCAFIYWIGDVLKNLFKIKRPSGSFPYGCNPPKNYGMPSKDMFLCFFTIFFIYLKKKINRIFYLILLITLVDFIFRYHCKYHSVLQMIVGAILGYIFALIFSLANMHERKSR